MAPPMPPALPLPMAPTLPHARRLLRQTAAAAILPCPLEFAGVHELSVVLASAADGELLTVGTSVLSTPRSPPSTGCSGSWDDCCYDDVKTRYLPLLDILGDSDFLKELATKMGYCLDCSLSIVLDRASENLELIRSERKRNMRTLNLY